MAYEQEQIDAYKDILESGFLGQVLKVTPGTVDFVTDEEVGETKTYSPAAMISLPTSNGFSSAFDNQYSEELIKGKIRFFMVAAKDIPFEMESGQYLIAQGEIFDVLGATPLKPSDTTILYNVGCMASGRDDLIPA